MRRSKQVPLILLGFAAISGCGEPTTVQQDQYRTRAECLQDWGNNPDDCKEVRTGDYDYISGPRYY